MESTSVIMEQSSPIFNTSLCSCRREMHSSFNVQCKTHNLEKMYTSSIDNPSIDIPKKGNLFQSMFGTMSNLLEQVYKTHNSIFSSLSVTPLSVTLVNNQSMVSDEILKTLIEHRDSNDDSERIKNTMVNHDSLICHQICDESDHPKYFNNKITMNKKVAVESVNSIELKPDTGGEIGLANVMMNALQKIFKTSSEVESKEDEVLKKRSCFEKHNHKSKGKIVANGRGRGRAKSQLRHSGVSQTRHKKERTKHNLEIDIQEDFETWEELRLSPMLNDPEDNKEPIENHADFTFADITPTVTQKNHCLIRKNKMSELCPTVKDINSMQRPRLISESSIDSEDSYCIVFESESDSDLTFENDSDSSFISDEDEETECKYKKASQPKVRFNLEPTIHVMIHWDYAYRAARRGPWEEMGRDRGRFKSRINCTKLVLDPVLTSSHRAHIWQQRFS